MPAGWCHMHVALSPLLCRLVGVPVGSHPDSRGHPDTTPWWLSWGSLNNNRNGGFCVGNARERQRWGECRGTAGAPATRRLGAGTACPLRGHRPQVAAGECWRSDAPRLYPDTQSRLARFPAHVSPQASCLPAQATPR